MKNFLSFILVTSLLLLAIPLLAFFGQDKKIKIAEEEPFNYKVLNHLTQEVLTLSPTDYIKGVVAAEMPISFHIEAIKAQAIAANTYALRQIDEQLKKPSPELKGAFLTTDFNKNQAYKSVEERKKMWDKNFDIYEKKLSDAVSSVIDTIITFEEKPIIAAFCSISSGKTESAKTVWGNDISYLTPVVSEGDELSPSYQTSTVLAKDEIVTAFQKKFKDIKFDTDLSKWFIINKKSPSGTILEIKVGTKTLSGKEVREILKLKSANFTVSYATNNFTFKIIGYGHGVGMSQYGADFYARQGMKCNDILSHYYVGTTLQKNSIFKTK